MNSEVEQLRTENESLKKSVHDLEEASKMLVRRDIDLKQAYEGLKLLDKQKSEFVSIAAHQLRTPLTSVKFSQQMLQESFNNELTDEQQLVLEQGIEGVRRMFVVIEDLITVDALDYGNLGFEPQRTNLEALIANALEVFTERLKEKGLRLEKHFSNTPKEITIDTKQISDVVSNLVDNAIKYTPMGGSITIETSYDDAHVYCRVIDTGIGVEESDLPHLFKKFSRLENAKRLHATGSGLGLYIGRKIVQKHNGDLEFSANTPEGSIFTIRLPI